MGTPWHAACTNLGEPVDLVARWGGVGLVTGIWMSIWTHFGTRVNFPEARAMRCMSAPAVNRGRRGCIAAATGGSSSSGAQGCLPNCMH